MVHHWLVFVGRNQTAHLPSFIAHCIDIWQAMFGLCGIVRRSRKGSVHVADCASVVVGVSSDEIRDQFAAEQATGISNEG